ncbi:MAG: elongation factor P [Verrucomicrobia bacterium]|nr:elongation factor P [Verrucomicrobiota bacterium]
MAQVSTNEFRSGLKVEVEGEPYTIISNEFIKPGKGQPFNRVKLKHLMTDRTIERTFKSGERLELADVMETKYRLLYTDADNANFMDDNSFEQIAVALKVVGDIKQWLMDEVIYSIIFYKGQPIEVVPPTFMEMTITESAPGLRGDTSGRVLKPATTETGAKVQVPLFVNEGDKIKVDTRTGEYVSRV